MGRLQRVVLVASLALFSVLGAAGTVNAQTACTGLDIAGGAAKFFDYGKGFGFTLDNADGVRFLDTWNEWRSANLDLGCPISQRWNDAGFVYQAFHGVILQSALGSNDKRVQYVLAVDRLAETANGESMLKQRGVPAVAGWAYPPTNGADQLAWAINKAFGNDLARYDTFTKFFSADPRYVDLVGLPTAPPSVAANGDIFLRCQRAVLVARPGGRPDLLDLTNEFSQSGLIPGGATNRVRGFAAPSLQIVDNTLPNRIGVRTEYLQWLSVGALSKAWPEWSVTANLKDFDPSKVTDLSASGEISWRGTDARSTLRPLITPSSVSFYGTGLPPAVIDRARQAARTHQPVVADVTLQLSGAFAGDPNWKSEPVKQPLSINLRESTLIENFGDFSYTSNVVLVLLLAGLGVIAIRKRGDLWHVGFRLATSPAGAVRTRVSDSRTNRKFRGFLEVVTGPSKGAFIDLEREIHVGPAAHGWLGGYIEAPVPPIDSTQVPLKLRVGFDGRLQVKALDSRKIRVGDAEKRGWADLGPLSLISVDEIALRFRDDPPVRRARNAAHAGSFAWGTRTGSQMPGAQPAAAGWGSSGWAGTSSRTTSFAKSPSRAAAGQGLAFSRKFQRPK